MMPLVVRIKQHLRDLYPGTQSRKELLIHFLAQGDQHSSITGRIADLTRSREIEVVDQGGPDGRRYRCVPWPGSFFR